MAVVPNYPIHNPGDTPPFNVAGWPNTRYGNTGPHGQTVNINWDVYFDDATKSWRVRVNVCTSAIDTTRRLVPGCTQIAVGLPPAGNTTNADFCNQVADLNTLGFRFFLWYDIAAVNAHEDVHVQEWIDAWDIEWPTLEAELENFSIVMDGKNPTEEEAIASLDHLVQEALDSAVTSANDAFQATGELPAEAAERPIVNPLIQAICNLARIQAGWHACPTIAPDGNPCR